jgi:hypothetical protein
VKIETLLQRKIRRQPLDVDSSEKTYLPGFLLVRPDMWGR